MRQVAPALTTAQLQEQIAQMPPRQLDVLYWLMRGASEKQVAATLAVSRHTVHNYIKTLFRRFGVCTRGELLSLWLYPIAESLRPSLPLRAECGHARVSFI